MSNTQPVAASLSEIKAAFPKAKADFVLKCLERSLPMASVMTEMISMMEEENNALRAEMEELKAKAMEDEQAKAKAMEEEKAKAKLEEEEEKEYAKAKAKAGVRPMAKASGTPQGSKKKWFQEFHAKVRSGMSRRDAVYAIEDEFPGLRQQMIDEVNTPSSSR